MVKYKTLRRKRSLSKFKVGMVSLGCDKNRVDSELILGSINKFYEITNNPKDAEIIIINTCGFIESAKQESIDTILEMAEYKKTHKCKMIIATGCLTQRYGDELLELIPEIDILMGVNDYMKLHKLIVDFIKTEQRVSSTTYKDEGVTEGERQILSKKAKELRENTGNQSADVDLLWESRIVAINGNDKLAPIEITQFLDEMNDYDSEYFMEYYLAYEGNYGLQTKLNYQCDKCNRKVESEMPSIYTFFRPTIKIPPII